MSEKKRNIKINEDAKDFAKASIKRYKKDNKGYFDSKKELKEAYSQYLLEILPGAIDFCVKYGHIQDEEVQGTKLAIYTKINDPEFIKLVKKALKHDDKIDNIKLFPIIGNEILEEAKKANDEILAADPNGKTYDVSDVVELIEMILSKKIKKLEKAGVPKAVAFDILTVIPNKSAIEYSQFYRIKTFYDRLYNQAKTNTIDFSKIMDVVIPEEYYAAFITFALLERKEKFTKLTDTQKKLYLDVSNWCFTIMDKKLSGKELEAVIKTYINSRKKDDAQGKDGNRRYSLTSLSKDEYERIANTVQNIIANDDSAKKYLG